MGKFFKTAQTDKKPITATASVEAAKAVISDATKAKAKASAAKGVSQKDGTLQKVYKSAPGGTFIDNVMNKISQFMDESKKPGEKTRSNINAKASAKAKASSGSTEGAKAKAKAGPSKEKSLGEKAMALWKDHGRGSDTRKIYNAVTGD